MLLLLLFQNVMRADAAKNNQIRLPVEGEAIGKRDACFPNVPRAFDLLCVQRRVVWVFLQKLQGFVHLPLNVLGKTTVADPEGLQDAEGHDFKLAMALAAVL